MASWADSKGIEHITTRPAREHPRCLRCGEIAGVVEAPAHDECVCEFGSCDECGMPFPTAAQGEAEACSRCERDIEFMTRETREMPALVIREAVEGGTKLTPDIWGEALQRMGVRS